MFRDLIRCERMSSRCGTRLAAILGVWGTRGRVRPASWRSAGDCDLPRLAPSDFGTVMVRTPLAKAAVILSPSTCCGKRSERWNAPSHARRRRPVRPPCRAGLPRIPRTLRVFFSKLMSTFSAVRTRRAIDTTYAWSVSTAVDRGSPRRHLCIAVGNPPGPCRL